MKNHFKVLIDGKELTVTIIKKNKKNISLQVKPNLDIILSIPIRTPYSYGLEIIKEKMKWIESKVQKYSTYTPSDGVHYLGTLYSHDAINSMIIQDLNTTIPLEEWYSLKLKDILDKKVKKLSQLMGVFPKKIRIKTLKSAWGICYSSGTITFNLNLIKVPLELIDYLVIHELGHFKHPNHSKEYWNYIGKYIEDPESYRRWLKENGYKYM